jgi:dihydroorotase
VSAGDAGANNFAGFRRFIVAQTRTRLYAFVHIANIGLTPFPLPELYNLDFAQVDACAKAVAENADIAIGVKVRMSENVIARNGAEPLRRAIQACEMAGTGGRVMAHIGGVENVALMIEILDLLRPGDILTHAYSGAPNLAGAFTNIVQDGRLLPAALAAKRRGVIFDVGHGGGSFAWRIAVPAIRQGFLPDSISTDLHIGSMNTGMKDMLNLMSKFLALGLSLDDVVIRSTWNPAKEIHHEELGNLSVGSPADVAVLRLENGRFGFTDMYGARMDGTQKLTCEMTVLNGKIVYDLNGISRPEWTTLPPDYTAVGDPAWDALNPRGGRAGGRKQ